MGYHAEESVSDEVGTVGNAACWLYLAAKLARGQDLKPNGRWVTDMAREEAGQPHGVDEKILPRGGIDIKGENCTGGVFGSDLLLVTGAHLLFSV